MALFDLLDPANDRLLSDAAESVSRAELSRRAETVANRLRDEGVHGLRLCLPLDSGLGSLATLVAVLEHGGRAALLARPAAGAETAWPGFCDALVLPPEPGASIDELRIERLPGGGPEDPAVGTERRIWLHSSGTTGKPKWILHDSKALIANARACVDRLGLHADDRVMIPVPIHHMFGLGAGLLPSLLAGAAIKLVARGNPLVVFQAQRSFDPTVMFMVPSQVRSILALGRKAGRARLVVVAGDRVAPDEAAAFEADHGHLIGLYGSSEYGAITASWPTDPAHLRHLTAGPPMEGVSLALDPDDATPEAEGALPMKIVHENGFMGYTDPDTGAMIAPAPRLWATGDLVKLHDGPDGKPRIEIMGRADHAVNRDGLLVHLGQIEGCLSRAFGVALSGVVAAGKSRRGTGIVAYCSLTRDGITTTEEILEHCRKALPARAVPDQLQIVPELPMLPSGKVDRRKLSSLAQHLAESRMAQG